MIPRRVLQPTLETPNPLADPANMTSPNDHQADTSLLACISCEPEDHTLLTLSHSLRVIYLLQTQDRARPPPTQTTRPSSTGADPQSYSSLVPELPENTSIRIGIDRVEEHTYLGQLTSSDAGQEACRMACLAKSDGLECRVHEPWRQAVLRLDGCSSGGEENTCALRVSERLSPPLLSFFLTRNPTMHLNSAGLIFSLGNLDIRVRGMA
ncbi:hypothetical protein QBC34DRAFT_135726 [Podospora aff. communis PSN243]|uniref:Apple domain-containing protein n=1 Tax=Podospora aff. communis PSN243 TaxID=3040156 RepID=A0AAV9H3L1_9PEZI|nr:hypothetical protein QBC34DRAFT_135726 [Podospora aff. communis PSN243]